MLRRALVAGGILVAVLAIAAPAVAHVTIQPGEAAQGGFTTQVFQVPNEEATANTVELEVTFPADAPIGSVSTQPVPGWQVQVDTTKPATPIKTDDGEVSEVVSKITWSGGAIEPGQFQQFPVSMGPLPKTASLTFKVLQTYSNGDIVRWIETAAPGGVEPDHPAPVLKLTAAKASAATASSTATAPKDVATSSDVDSAKTIGIVGIVLGALGLLLAVVALVRRPRVAR